MFNNTGGVPRSPGFIPSTTTLDAVYTNQITGKAILQAVNIAAIAGADLSISVNDGTTDFYLISAATYAADDHELIEWDHGIILEENHIIKVKTSVADSISLVFTISEMHKGV